MSEQRKERKFRQGEHADPINYTCGVCNRVHPFDSEKPYECPDNPAPEPEIPAANSEPDSNPAPAGGVI